jgi:ubiquinol-cytochrome c reductase cytochrome c subunit
LETERGRPAGRRRPRPPLLVAVVVAGCALTQLAFGAPARPAPAVAQSATQGRELYLRDCASCHGQDGRGSHRGPSLVGVGGASADFQLTTGRMPLDRERSAPERRPPAYDQPDIDALVAYVASLGGGPPVPVVGPGDLGRGRRLYQANCAACHGATGVGGALTNGRVAPPLGSSTPTQVAEATRVGPGLMPVFGDQVLSAGDVDAVAAYVDYLDAERVDRGGLGLGRLGPVTEGLVGWVLGLGLVVLLARRIGTRGRG